MKLNYIDHKKKEEIKSCLDAIDQMIKISRTLDKVRQIEEWYINWNECLNIIYVLFTGKDEKTIYHLFDSPSNAKKPIAWIDKESGYPHQGFIPDSINGIIIDKNMTTDEKFTALYELFTLLEDLHQKPTKNSLKDPIVFEYAPKVRSR